MINLYPDPFPQTFQDQSSQQNLGENSSILTRTSDISPTNEELEFDRMIREHESLFQDSQNLDEEEERLGWGKKKMNQTLMEILI